MTHRQWVIQSGHFLFSLHLLDKLTIDYCYGKDCSWPCLQCHPNQDQEKKIFEWQHPPTPGK